MRGGVLLDPVTGRPEQAERDAHVSLAGMPLATLETFAAGLGRELPPSIRRNLRKARRFPVSFLGNAGYQALLFATDATATAVVGTSEGALHPDYWATFTPPYFLPAKKIRITAWGTLTTAGASPGNLTLQLRYSTVGAPTGGVSLCSSGALALTTSITNDTWMTMVELTVRSDGSSGTMMATGFFACNSALSANNKAFAFMPATGAATASVDTTAQKVLVLTATLGSASDSMAIVQYGIESLN